MKSNWFSGFGHKLLKEGAAEIARDFPEKAEAILSALYNYNFHWLMSLDFNQSRGIREYHQEQAQHYAEKIIQSA